MSAMNGSSPKPQPAKDAAADSPSAPTPELVPGSIPETASKPPSEADQELSLARVLRGALLFAVFFAAMLGTLHLSGVVAYLTQAHSDTDGFVQRFRDFGAYGVLIFLGLLAIRPLVFIPGVWLAPVAALLFGTWMGALYKVLGETLAACVAFGVTRFGLAERLGIRTNPQSRSLIARLDRALERKSFLTVLGLRLNLAIPYDVLNYGLGITRVRIVGYVLGTLIGIVPGTFVYVAMSSSALQGDWIKTALWIGGVLLMILLTIPLARQLLRESAEPDAS